MKSKIWKSNTFFRAWHLSRTIVCLSLIAGPPCFSFTAVATANVDTTRTETLSDADDFQSVDRLTERVIKLQFALYKWVSSFRLEHFKKRGGRAWRIFAWNMASLAAAEGNALSLTIVSWKNFNDPAKGTKAQYSAAPIQSMISNSITLVGMASEAAFDARRNHEIQRKGLGVRDAEKYFVAADQEIFALLTKRAALVEDKKSRVSAEQMNILQTEDDGLQMIRSMTCVNFINACANIKRARAAGLLNDLITASSAATQGYAGALPGLVSAQTKNIRLTGTAGLGFAIGGVLLIPRPVLVTYLQKLASQHEKQRLLAMLPNVREADTQQVDALLNKIEATKNHCLTTELAQSGSLIKRLETYKHQLSMFRSDPPAVFENPSTHFKSSLLKSAYIGGSTVAAGTMLAVGGFGHYRDPKQALIDFGIGGIVFSPIYNYSMFDILQQRVRESVAERKAAAGPNQRRAEQRLQLLEELEDGVKAF